MYICLCMYRPDTKKLDCTKLRVRVILALSSSALLQEHENAPRVITLDLVSSKLLFIITMEKPSLMLFQLLIQALRQQIDLIVIDIVI